MRKLIMLKIKQIQVQILTKSELIWTIELPNTYVQNNGQKDIGLDIEKKLGTVGTITTGENENDINKDSNDTIF
jgi:hypothetical protein